jgi:4-amino-4-deoxy-L-arabinose transferase-like glycosyltransferase
MRKSLSIATLLILFLACYRLTTPDYIGDTTRYAHDTIGHAQGIQTQFWDFGHLLWRPWGYVGYSLLAPWCERRFGDTPEQAITRFLIQTNLICSTATLALMLLLLRKVARGWIAFAVALAMSCSYPFIDYSHSGAPYIPALLFSVLAFLLLTIAAESPAVGRRGALLAGVSFAIACALWFPYCITGLGMLLVLWLWPAAGPALRRGLLRDFLLALAASVLLLFGAGAAAKGIRNAGELTRWIKESDNGWSQSMTAVRVVTGLPRAIWNFGGDTVLLKRRVFSDPYNPVGIRALIFGLGAKVAVFYLALAATVWVLWKERRPILFILAGAALPLLLFAVAVFEPSSPERFVPAFPFAFVAFAAVIETARRHLIAASCVIALLASSVVFNLAQNGRGLADARLAQTRLRMQALNSTVQEGALIFLVTFNDDLYRLHTINPLDKSLAMSRFEVTDAVELASQRMAHWRDEFSKATQERWARGKEVWISDRLLAPRPEAAWLWVEGDDRRIRWIDLPATFEQLEYDSKILPGADGFLRVAQTQPNRELLAKALVALH